MGAGGRASNKEAIVDGCSRGVRVELASGLNVEGAGDWGPGRLNTFAKGPRSGRGYWEYGGKTRR